MFVISCHADTRFREHQLHRLPDGSLTGHLDNFAGVHAVMLAYFSGHLPQTGVRIELTYGEETGFDGAYEARQKLRSWDGVVVVDVSGTPTSRDFVIEKCADPRMKNCSSVPWPACPSTCTATAPTPSAASMKPMFTGMFARRPALWAFP
jgi:hypothetical protein